MADRGPLRVVPRLVVFGSLNRDLVMQVPWLPRTGETVSGSAVGFFCGGKGANQAIAGARLNANVYMAGRVGGDEAGTSLMAALAEDGVDVSGVTIDISEPTGTALILVAPNGDNIIAVAGGANSKVGESDVTAALDLLDRGDVLLTQLEIPLGSARSAILGAAQRGASVVLNASPVSVLDRDLLEAVDFLVVNETEAAQLWGQPVHDVTTAESAARRGRLSGARLPIVTIGQLGAVLLVGDKATHVPAFTLPSVDSTGAGDAFIAGLATGILEGLSPVAAARLGTAAAGLATTKHGAASSLPHRPEADALLARHPEFTIGGQID
jgi:ribokinase